MTDTAASNLSLIGLASLPLLAIPLSCQGMCCTEEEKHHWPQRDLLILILPLINALIKIRGVANDKSANLILEKCIL